MTKIDASEQLPTVLFRACTGVKECRGSLATERSKNEDLAEKLSKLSVRNTNKKLRRREKKKKRIVITSLKL